MSRKTSLSILFLIPLTLTGYSLQAKNYKQYPCIVGVGECLFGKPNAKSCMCGAVIDPSSWSLEKQAFVDIKKIRSDKGCSAANFTFPQKYDSKAKYQYPLCIIGNNKEQ